MVKPINLNKLRKSRAKILAKRKADENAALHGLPKAEKEAARAEEERSAKAHAAGKLDRKEDPDAGDGDPGEDGS